nr:hypothetical protein [Tanacetum cinerariifolium]
MQTRSSSRLTRDQTSFQQKVKNSSLEEHLPPIVTMADNRTMAELLRAPTEGYAEAIVVPPILAEQFELKHSLINMMTTDRFFGLEKDNPHDHIHCQSANECCDYRHDGYAQTISSNPPPAPVKAVEEIYVTCGGAHPYYQCLATGGNTFSEFRDNIQGYVSAAAVNYNQGNPGYRPQGAANQIWPPDAVFSRDIPLICADFSSIQVFKSRLNPQVSTSRYVVPTGRYVVSTGRVVVPTGRYVVHAGNVIIVSPGRIQIVIPG